jgi:PAS domain S-box-containing protein
VGRRHTPGGKLPGRGGAGSNGSEGSGPHPSGGSEESDALLKRCQDLEGRLEALRKEFERLSASELHYRSLSEQFHDIIIEINSAGEVVYASPRLRELLGYKPAELAGRSPFELVHPDDRDALMESFKTLIETGVSQRPVFRTRRADGKWHWVESSGRVFRTATGEQHAVVLTRDVAGREEIQEALERSEARYRTLVESVHDLVAEIDEHGHLLYVSPVVQEVLGYDASRTPGVNALERVHPDDVQAVERAFRKTLDSGEPVRIELRYRHRDGSWRWVEAKGRPIAGPGGVRRWVLIARDVTDRVRAENQRRQLEAQIQQSQKLESLGILAGGIAHDFNNLLTSILGYADLASRDLDQASPARASVDQIREAGQRAADLTRQLLAYAGRGRIAIEAVDLSSLVESMIQLLKVSVSKRAKLEWNLSSKVPPVLGDAGQISQVVLNLITNASDSLGDKDGAISIHTGVDQVDGKALSRTYLRDDLPEGRYAFVEVEDTGIGMDEETRARIFDPFFTTKFRGRGLGLAAVLGIVRAHGGTITVESRLGRGSRFRVLLPCAADETEVRSVVRGPAGGWRGWGTVLVVDDEPDVRSIAARMLALLGFDVVLAENGRQAVEQFQEQSDRISLVLLDLTMPQMDGEEALEQFHTIRAEVPVVFMSGYPNRDHAAEVEGGNVGFLQKPFTMADLETAIRGVLEPEAIDEPDPFS